MNGGHNDYLTLAPTARPGYTTNKSCVHQVSGIIGWIGVGSAVIIWLILYWQSFVIATPLLYLAAFLLPSIGFILAFLLAKITCQVRKTLP